MLINKEWKVESDELNYTILRRLIVKEGNKHAGQENWVIEGYFYNLPEVLKWFINHEIKGTGLKDLETILEKIGELEKTLCFRGYNGQSGS